MCSVVRPLLRSLRWAVEELSWAVNEVLGLSKLLENGLNSSSSSSSDPMCFRFRRGDWSPSLRMLLRGKAILAKGWATNETNAGAELLILSGSLQR